MAGTWHLQRGTCVLIIIIEYSQRGIARYITIQKKNSKKQAKPHYLASLCTVPSSITQTPHSVHRLQVTIPMAAIPPHSSSSSPPPHEIIVVPDVGQQGREELREQCYALRIAVFHHEQKFPLDTEIDESVPILSFHSAPFHLFIYPLPHPS